ncbi:MAG: LytTR family DNA-binding domain-containing protein [Gammaproteobacteria bacterium]|jgi:two-component system, LytTR family, response regulator AlgR
MKVMIVDDESPARERLRRLLGQVPECRVCAEAANGREALQAAARSEPDVVLLDIRMPGMDGLEAARHLADLEQPPAVIFSTAYGEHALEAFEAHAVDYLLKPIRAERLDDALRKARRLTRAQAQALTHDSGAEARARTHICARVRGNLELVPVDAVRCFEADQKYVTVHHPDGTVLIEDSLRTLEGEFGARFVRIHRRTLVAVAFLEGLEKDESGKSRVRLAGIQERPEVSRRHLAAVRGLLKRA